jgi:RNA polymerase sigma factor (sigma-70 family)
MTATAGLNGFVDRLRAGLGADPRSDGDLVREFATTGCQAAFAELVRRFAPMVWGVCRRTVHDRQLAEDAFQAVFLVLVRKAGAIQPAAVAGWLHTVAVHTSTRARAMADRRKARTRPLADHPAEEPAEPTDGQLLRALDEEIARLPESLRAAVALCELGGVSRKEAAARLGIAEGTLSSRLASARKRLGATLRARGVGLAVALSLLPRSADAAPVVCSSASGVATSLADGAIRAMFLTKLKLPTAVAVLAALLLGGGVAVAASPEPKDDPKPLKARAKPKVEGKLLFWLDDQPILLKPDGTEDGEQAMVANAGRGVGWGNAVVSPDGKRVAFEKQGAAVEIPAPKDGAKPHPISRTRTTLHLLEFDAAEDAKPVTLADVHLNGFHWLAGGKLHVRGYEIDAKDVVDPTLRDWIWDPANGKRTPLKVPESFVVRALSPDGKTAVVDEWKMGDEVWHQRAHLWAVGSDDKPTPLFELNQGFENLRPQFSPDGQKLLCKLLHYGTYTPLGNKGFTQADFKFRHLLVVDLKTKKQTVVKDLGENGDWGLSGFAWSPDGKRVAYVESNHKVPLPQGRRPFRVMVADADGKNESEVYNRVGGWLIGFDWK